MNTSGRRDVTQSLQEALTADTVPTTPPPSCEGDDDGPVTLRIHPYLQQVTPTSAWVMWETDEGVGSRVDFGESALDQVACGERVPSFSGGDPDEAETQVHATQLTGLLPDTTYRYRVRTGAPRVKLEPGE